MSDKEIVRASAEEVFELACQEAGCSREEMVLMLRILKENGGSMHVDDLEREWTRRIALEASK